MILIPKMNTSPLQEGVPIKPKAVIQFRAMVNNRDGTFTEAGENIIATIYTEDAE